MNASIIITQYYILMLSLHNENLLFLPETYIERIYQQKLNYNKIMYNII